MHVFFFHSGHQIFLQWLDTVNDVCGKRKMCSHIINSKKYAHYTKLSNRKHQNSFENQLTICVCRERERERFYAIGGIICQVLAVNTDECLYTLLLKQLQHLVPFIHKRSLSSFGSITLLLLNMNTFMGTLTHTHT